MHMQKAIKRPNTDQHQLFLFYVILYDCIFRLWATNMHRPLKTTTSSVMVSKEEEEEEEEEGTSSRG